MKKILLMLLCLSALLLSGCDKFAKEKEEVARTEKAAMAMELPTLVRPDFSKQARPDRKTVENSWKKYQEDLDKFIEVEEKILAEMRKTDARIAEMEARASNDSEKKDLREFKDNVQKARKEFVKKISKGRLYGDTFIVGVGSTWQEVEMVYGKPVNVQKPNRGFREYKYDGIEFEDHIGGGAYPPGSEKLKKWRSKSVESVFLTGTGITSDAGVKIGMTHDEVFKILKSKYVKKSDYQKEEMHAGKGYDHAAKKTFDVIVSYSMQETSPFNMFVDFTDNKLTRYVVAPN